MKKTPIILILLVIIALFAGADYYLNNLKAKVALDAFKTPDASATVPVVKDSGFADSIFKLSSDVNGYNVAAQTETSQIFEKIDLSNIKNIKIYKDQLEKTLPPVATTPAPATSPTTPTTPTADTAPAQAATPDTAVTPAKPADKDTISIYEIHGPAGQGSLTYLNVKLQFIAQINGTTEILNDTGEYGQSSFFYNDTNNTNIAFLLTQVGDNLYAFMYSKASPDTFTTIKTIIGNLKSSLKP